MKNFENIKRPKVVEEIIEAFKQKLIMGELRPGDKLPSETQLMEQLGVGRTALREALKMLSALGVIDVRQGDGTYMLDEPSCASLNPLVFALLLQAGMNNDLLELRTLLEVGYCQIAAEKATEADIASIENAANKFEALVLSPDKEINLLTQADLEFHYSIMNATGNPLVILISRTVEELFFTSIRNTISKIEGRKWGIEGHRNIIAAIKDNDPLRIREAVIVSLERWSEDLEEKPLLAEKQE
jgi:GntR family transcriptional repressor for pyruvate dehydrogenase complex